MAYEWREFPEWSWSHSRRQTFQECPRKYFYQYYGAHNGWFDGAPDPTRLVYRLKQLTSLPLEMGGAIHSAAAFAIQSARSGGGIPSFDTLHDKVRHDLNQAWKDSHDRLAWEREPRRRKMFHEFYYGTGFSDPAIEESRQHVRACLTNLLASQSFREVISAPQIEVRQVENMVAYDIDGTRIYGTPDILYRLGDDTWTVTDWKTGHERVDWGQLSIYALYVHEQHGVHPDNIRARIEWLASGNADERRFSQDDLRDCRAGISDSISSMRKYLADTVVNSPRERSEFPLRNDTSACGNCKFFELDEEEIATRAPGPF